MILRGPATGNGLRTGRKQAARCRSATPAVRPSRQEPAWTASARRQSTKARAAQLDKEETAQEEEELKETYDVYVHEPVPLAEGVEKHVISVLVSDESGLINRVAGVCARRGANIESLAVGLTQDKALFTIVVNGSKSYVATLVKNLSKLVNVRYVEDLTGSKRVEREMVMFKVSARAGAERTEVMQLAEIFRAKINDVSDRTLTLLVSGDPGKLAALEKQLAPFGIVEMVRSGRVSLRRGELLNFQHLMPDSLRHTGVYHPQGTNGNGNGADEPHTEDPALPKGDDIATWSLDNTAVDPELGNAPPPKDTNAETSDVYFVSDKDMSGHWSVQNLLDPVFDDDMNSEYNVHTLSIEVSNTPGVLNQVTGCFARRGYNIQSLAVGPSEKPDTSRITVVVPGSDESISKLFRQLRKLVYVQSLEDLTFMPMQQRELMLVKVRCTPQQRGQVRNLEQIFRASILDIGPNTVLMSLMGKAGKLRALCELLEPYGILEIARTGRIALKRDSGVDSAYLARMATQKVY